MTLTVDAANKIDARVNTAFLALPEGDAKESMRHALHAVQDAITAHFNATGENGYKPNDGGGTKPPPPPGG